MNSDLATLKSNPTYRRTPVYRRPNLLDSGFRRKDDSRQVAAWPWLIAALISIAVPGESIAQEQPRFPCAYSDKDCAAKAQQGHAVTKLHYWERAMGKPVEQRIGVAPPALVEFLRLDNIANDVRDTPRAARLTPGFLRDVQRALAEIPPEVKRLLATKLAGIYLVENLGSTGFGDVIYDKDANPAGGFVVLDASVLSRRVANAWATWKENTPFAPRAGFRLAAEIETPRNNNRRNAIQYILLHELAHVISIGEKFHPSWSLEPRDVQSPENFPFFLLSWAIDRAENRYVTLFDAAFPQRKDVVYYFGAKLAADQMIAAYDNLERTNFATLYSVVRPGDDFAEAFASYVHSVRMKKPFAIRIYDRGKLVKTYGSCWTEPRCAEKRKLIEGFLGASR